MSTTSRTVYNFRKQIRQFAVPLLMFFIILYCYVQMFSEDRGIVSWLDLKRQVTKLERDNRALHKEVLEGEARLARLQINTLDPDFLDEQIRRQLPMMHANEIVIFKK